MKIENTIAWENIFNKVCDHLFSKLRSDECLNINFDGEQSLFMRFNNSKIRQVTQVDQATLELKLVNANRSAQLSLGISATALEDEELSRIENELGLLQSEVDSLPEDPYATTFTSTQTSHSDKTCDLLSANEYTSILSECFQDNIDLAGYLTSGHMYKGTQNNLGGKHWFSNSSFFIDYSLYSAKQKAVKGNYAGQKFDGEVFQNQVKTKIEALNVLGTQAKELSAGKYRVYLAPSAVNEIMETMNWGGFSASAYHRGQSPCAYLKDGQKLLDPKVTMSEDFSVGLCPQFNEIGEVSTERIDLIKNGRFENFLTSSASAKEFDLEGNNAGLRESPNSLVLDTGELKQEDILKRLGTGLYLSNLHYINWSDRNNGRLTGMTRFGCLWVEDSKVVGPIKDMRFDETIYHIFGDGLIELTNFSEVSVSTSTYFGRSFGAMKIPGALIENFSLTL